MAAILVELSFVARAGARSWKEFVEHLGMTARPVPWAEWNVEAFALPEPLKPEEFFLKVEVHPMRDDPEKTHWVLTYERVRGPVPPKHVAESNSRVGGFERLHSRLIEGWLADRKVEADVKVRHMVDGSQWASRLFPPQARDQEFAGTVVHLEDALWRWKYAQGGRETTISAFALAKDANRVVTMERNCEVTLEPEVCSRLEQDAWETFRKFMKKRATKKRK